MSDFMSSALGSAAGVTIGEAFIKLRPDGSSFAGETSSKLKEALTNPLVVGGAAVAAFGVAAEKVAVSSVAKFTDLSASVKGLQRVTGGTAEDMSRLKFAADQTGVSSDSLAIGFKTLSRNIVANSDSIKNSGIAFRDAHGNILPMNATLGNVAQKFASMPDGVQKNALAMQLFGKAGTDLIPVLNKGRDGLAELAAKSDAYGLTLSQKNIDDVRKYTMAQKDLHSAFSGLEVQLGVHLLPIFSKVVETVSNTLIPVFEKVSKVLSEKLSPFFKDVSDKVSTLLSTLGDPSNKGHNFSDWVANTLTAAIDGLQKALDKAWPYISDFISGLFGQEADGGRANTAQRIGQVINALLGYLKDFGDWWANHPTLFKDVAESILGVWAAWEAVTTTKKVIDITTDGVDTALQAINTVAGALAKITDKVVNVGANVAGKVTEGAAQGAGQSAGQAGGGALESTLTGAAGGAGGDIFGKILDKLGGPLRTFIEGLKTKIGAIVGTGGLLSSIMGTEASIPIWGWIALGVTAVAALAFAFRKPLLKFVKDIPGWITEAAEATPGFAKVLVEAGSDVLEGLERGAKRAWKAVVKFFRNLPYEIGYAIGFQIGLLGRVGGLIVGALFKGIKEIWEKASPFFKELPGNIVELVGDVGSTLYDKGRDLISGARDGIQDAWRDVREFFANLARTVFDTIGDVAHSIYDKGRDLLQGLWQGIQDFWHDPIGFFQRLPQNILDTIGDVASTLFNKGRDLISGIANGIWDFWNNTLWPWLTGFMGNVKKAFEGAVTWLRQAGWDLLKGLADGIGDFLKGVGGTVEGWGKSIGTGLINGVKAGFGSHSPSKKMHAEGINLIQGLANGLEAHRPVLDRTLGSITKDILGVGGLGINGGRLSVAGPGVTVKNYNLSVNSNYQSEADPITWFNRMTRMALPR